MCILQVAAAASPLLKAPLSTAAQQASYASAAAYTAAAARAYNAAAAAAQPVAGYTVAGWESNTEPSQLLANLTFTELPFLV